MSTYTRLEIREAKTRVDSLLENLEETQHDNKHNVDEKSNKRQDEHQSIESTIEFSIEMKSAFASNRDQVNNSTQSDENARELYMKNLNDDEEIEILDNRQSVSRSRDDDMIHID